jgi:hypothetical protein
MPAIKEYVGRTLVALGTWAKRDPLATIFWVGCATLVLWGIVYRAMLTPEQVRAGQMAEAQQAAQQAQKARQEAAQEKASQERNRALCKLKSTCEQYGRVRQECATAGSFQTCVRVKMGDENVEEVGSCTNDGHVAYSEPVGSIDCWLSKIQ